MTLLERLKSFTPADHDRDAVEFFGAADGSEITVRDGMLTVGGESISFEKALEAAYGPPGRTVEIGNLAAEVSPHPPASEGIPGASTLVAGGFGAGMMKLSDLVKGSTYPV